MVSQVDRSMVQRDALVDGGRDTVSMVAPTVDEERAHSCSTGAGNVMLGVVADEQTLFGAHPKLLGEGAKCVRGGFLRPDPFGRADNVERIEQTDRLQLVELLLLSPVG